MILRHFCFAVHPVCLILTFSQHLLRNWSSMFKYKLGSNSSEYRGQHYGWRRFWMMKTMFFLNRTFCSFLFGTYASLVKPNNRLHCLHVIPSISITGHKNLVLVVYAYFWGASPLLDAEYWHICHQKNHLKTSQVSVCWNKKLVKYWYWYQYTETEKTRQKSVCWNRKKLDPFENLGQEPQILRWSIPFGHVRLFYFEILSSHCLQCIAKRNDWTKNPKAWRRFRSMETICFLIQTFCSLFFWNACKFS